MDGDWWVKLRTWWFEPKGACSRRFWLSLTNGKPTFPQMVFWKHSMIISWCVSHHTTAQGSCFLRLLGLYPMRSSAPSAVGPWKSITCTNAALSETPQYSERCLCGNFILQQYISNKTKVCVFFFLLQFLLCFLYTSCCCCCFCFYSLKAESL